MLIYFNGDSNTAGSELSKGESFPEIIARYYDAKSINHAVGGCSCDHIIRTTRTYIDQCKAKNAFPDLIVIGWTEWNREEWFRNGRYDTASMMFKDQMNQLSDSEKSRLEYFETYITKPEFTGAAAVYYNNAIYNLHCEFKDLGIPHLFFNAILPLDVSKIMLTPLPILKHDFENSYFHPYSNKYAMRQWCLDNNFDQVTPGYFHFVPAAQQAWASLLLKQIDQILSTSAA